VHFTQFLFPNGRRAPVEIDMPPEVEAKAEELRKAGWSFETECFPDTQIVHADCCDDDDVLADEVCSNGPDVLVMVERLVRKAHERWTVLGRPAAKGSRAVRAVDNY
jgi:hypothetical protein